MIMALSAIGFGLLLLVWSADRFVEGAASAARHFGMPSLLIGMVILGFGTSAPEMVVSGTAASHGNPGIALGNAYGSNITNIALVLGITALISPIRVQSKVLRKELPILTAVTALAAFQLWDGHVSRTEGVILLVLFAMLMTWTVWQGMRRDTDTLGVEIEHELQEHDMGLRRGLVWLVIGLVLLVGSSQLLVWGAVEVAHRFGVSDLVIGLTIIAIGTSLPELAASSIAAIKGEHDIALGNILGSNLFNTLAVVGIAGSITPIAAGPEVLSRDIAVMSALTLSLFIFCYGFRRPGRVSRIDGFALLVSYFAYMGYLAYSVLWQ